MKSRMLNSIRHRIFNFAGGFLLLAVLAPSGQARVVAIQITSRNSFAEGSSFGATGAYETIQGTVTFQVDPADSRNKVVFDLNNAPRNSAGLVQFTADFFIFKPVDMAKGNGALLAEVPNRGSKTLLTYYNDATSAANVNTPSVAVDLQDSPLLQMRRRLSAEFINTP